MQTFNQLFNVLVGRKGKFKAMVGTTGSFTLTMPAHDITDIRFEFSLASFMFFRNYNLLQVHDQDGNLVLASNRSISIFSNKSGKDPRRYPQVGKSRIRGKERYIGLKPSTSYQVTYRGRKPQTLTYVGLYEEATP